MKSLKEKTTLKDTQMILKTKWVKVKKNIGGRIGE